MHYSVCKKIYYSASVHAIYNENILVEREVTGATYTTISCFFSLLRSKFSSSKPSSVTFGNVVIDVNVKEVFQNFLSFFFKQLHFYYIICHQV